MKDYGIIDFGKIFFSIFFVLGNIALFGYLITKLEGFAEFGFHLLLFGGAINLVALAGLLIYGATNKPERTNCLKSAGFLLLNLPIAVLYAVIGINII